MPSEAAHTDQAVPVLEEVGSYRPEHLRWHQGPPNLAGESLVQTVLVLQVLLDLVRDHACAAAQEQIDLEEDVEADGWLHLLRLLLLWGRERSSWPPMHGWTTRGRR